MNQQEADASSAMLDALPINAEVEKWTHPTQIGASLSGLATVEDIIAAFEYGEAHAKNSPTPFDDISAALVSQLGGYTSTGPPQDWKGTPWSGALAYAASCGLLRATAPDVVAHAFTTCPKALLSAAIPAPLLSRASHTILARSHPDIVAIADHGDFLLPVGDPAQGAWWWVHKPQLTNPERITAYLPDRAKTRTSKAGWTEAITSEVAACDRPGSVATLLQTGKRLDSKAIHQGLQQLTLTLGIAQQHKEHTLVCDEDTQDAAEGSALTPWRVSPQLGLAPRSSRQAPPILKHFDQEALDQATATESTTKSEEDWIEKYLQAGYRQAQAAKQTYEHPGPVTRAYRRSAAQREAWHYGAQLVRIKREPEQIAEHLKTLATAQVQGRPTSVSELPTYAVAGLIAELSYEELAALLTNVHSVRALAETAGVPAGIAAAANARKIRVYSALTSQGGSVAKVPGINRLLGTVGVPHPDRDPAPPETEAITFVRVNGEPTDAPLLVSVREPSQQLIASKPGAVIYLNSSNGQAPDRFIRLVNSRPPLVDSTGIPAAVTCISRNPNISGNSLHMNTVLEGLAPYAPAHKWATLVCPPELARQAIVEIQKSPTAAKCLRAIIVSLKENAEPVDLPPLLGVAIYRAHDEKLGPQFSRALHGVMRFGRRLPAALAGRGHRHHRVANAPAGVAPSTIRVANTATTPHKTQGFSH